MATHLKSLAKRAMLNEGHVKAAKVYKARVATLTFERAVLRDRMQNMTEEVVKLKSDLRHTMTERAWAEGREEKARDGLRVAKGELRGVKDGLQAAQTELQVIRDELQSSQNELRVIREVLHAVRDELRNKATLLDGARREAFEVVSSIERLTEECHGLRGDLQRQETLVVQRGGAITSLRDEACTQWAFGWLAFQRKAANTYPGLDIMSHPIPGLTRLANPNRVRGARPYTGTLYLLFQTLVDPSLIT